MKKLLPCPGCKRHLRAAEAFCHFCAIGLAIAACHGSSSSQSSAAPPAASSSAPATSESGEDLGLLRIQSGSDGGLSSDREQAAVYGGPPAQAGPTGLVDIAAMDVHGMANADFVLRSELRAKAKACYERALANDPTTAGTVKLALKIASDGTVDSADAESTGSGMPSVATCIAGVARRLTFTSTAATTVGVTYRFVKRG